MSGTVAPGGGGRAAAPAEWSSPGSFAPSAGTVDLWRAVLIERSGDVELLSTAERARAERLIVPAKRQRFIAARAALRRVLGRYLDAPAHTVAIGVREHGKPFLDRQPRAWSFNLSHSEALALVAVGEAALLGVDVEFRERDRPLEQLAERFFSPLEAAAYAALAAADRPAAFYRTWCRKEAYVKAWGTGLAFSSRRFTVALGDDPRWLLATDMPGDDAVGWWLCEPEPAFGYAAALCWRGAPAVVRAYDERRDG